MRSPAGALLLLLLLLVAAAACGGDGDAPAVKTFDDDAYGITFRYPGELDQRDDFGATATAGAEPVEETALMLDDENGIVVSKYALNFAVDAGNIDDVKPEVDSLASSLAGETTETEKIELGGFPGFTFEADVEEPEGGRSRIALLFDGRTEYTLNCVFTPPKRDEIDAACDQVFESVQRK